ncbi:Core-2/I-Branching enzyme [Pedobacter sp. ok626]|uniref:beta-1,6-N-acetylglucosaminyltransferase n=1 Tax=Pedobacter sp. ok626 TaxID=1761882 RepID=UPI000890AC03|nr:beta-1,6-N-acetylglucosaminyltransferase [Pedobacter sp. ok626]SDJ56572.1 Core-2/I-Branching enzyme [Pedobacter sp. ok626]
MKIAHLIMAYKNPDQIERMIRAMDHPDFYFFVHLDLKINYKSFEHLSKIDRVIFIENRVLCNWGGFSFVKAIFSSLSEILNRHKDFDFFNLMSGQDYPIKPINDIHNFYLQNPGKCFISYDVDPQRNWWGHAEKRAQLYHFTDFSFKGRYFLQKMLNKYFPVRKFPLKMKLYGSSNSSWWTISAECAAYVTDFMKCNPKLNDFMKFTWGSDEFLLATIIMNSSFSDKTVNNNFRFITWVDGMANPRILTAVDFESIKSSPDFFARKFDTNVDTAILDKLDRLINS